jgi:hypothetical protein
MQGVKNAMKSGFFAAAGRHGAAGVLFWLA